MNKNCRSIWGSDSKGGKRGVLTFLNSNIAYRTLLEHHVRFLSLKIKK